MCPAIIGEFLEDLVSRSIYSLLRKWPWELPTQVYVNVLYLYRSTVVLLQYGGNLHLLIALTFCELPVQRRLHTYSCLLRVETEGSGERIKVCEGWGIVQCTYIISILIATGRKAHCYTHDAKTPTHT